MPFSIRDLARPVIPIVNKLTGGAVLGVDIGTSSIKIVQLHKGNGEVLLDSYGSVDLDMYREPTAASDSHIKPERLADAIMDLMHEVAITSRVAGISLPASSTMILMLEMPNRDKEQQKRLMYSEAQKYIPGNMEDISLDWFVLPEPSDRRNAFDVLKSSLSVVAKPQRVLVAAMSKVTIKTYDAILKASNLSPIFYEIEAFSSARATPQKSPDPVLMIDIGSRTSTLSIVEENIVRTLHAVEVAGVHLTTALATTMQWDLPQAESHKCTHGLTPSPYSSIPENTRVKRALTGELDRIVSEAQRVITTNYEQHQRSIVEIILSGGGARMLGLAGYFSEALHLPVEIAQPFAHVKAPIVLEERMKAAGPLFTNAIGLGLRAL